MALAAQVNLMRICLELVKLKIFFFFFKVGTNRLFIFGSFQMQEQRSGTYSTPHSHNKYCSFLMALKCAVELLQS